MINAELAKEYNKLMEKAKMLYSRYNLLILLLLAQKPMTGYELMGHISSIWLGLLEPGPSTIYPKLYAMVKAGLIEGREEFRNNKRVIVYSLTHYGKTLLKAAFPIAHKINQTITSLLVEAEKNLEDVEPDPVASRIVWSILNEHQ